MNKRENTDVRQEQIKQAVLSIIYSDGLKNLSISNLAKRIELSDGAIFRHFRSKQEIIVSIIDDVQKDFISHLRKIATSTDEPEVRLEKFIYSTVEYLTANKGITMLLFSEASFHNDKLLKEKLLQILNNQKNLISKIILDGIATAKWDEMIPVEYVAMLYMGIPVSLNAELMINDGELYPHEFSDRMFRLLLKLLSKS
jgi:TetR/AcrR family transcriptional regulator